MPEPTPFAPENVILGDDGRWYHDGVDVTDVPVTWRCRRRHRWTATIGQRTSPDDTGCPTCRGIESIAEYYRQR